MKIPASRRQHGFTLVELLVVIAIIAVLAAAGFAAGNAAIQKAKKVTALSSATALESAVNNFFNEYNYMPDKGTADATRNTKIDAALLNVLLGLESDSNDMLNTRKVKFLSAKEGKADKNGLIYNTNGTSARGLYDPWGGGFYVMLDLDFDEKLNTNVSGVTTVLNGRRVAVWSLGADGVSGTGGKAGDDVKTF